jgi:hypothetical protein
VDNRTNQGPLKEGKIMVGTALAFVVVFIICVAALIFFALILSSAIGGGGEMLSGAISWAPIVILACAYVWIATNSDFTQGLWRSALVSMIALALHAWYNETRTRDGDGFDRGFAQCFMWANTILAISCAFVSFTQIMSPGYGQDVAGFFAVISGFFAVAQTFGATLKLQLSSI